MNPKRIDQISESLIEFNRERYRNELAQGVFELMRSQGVRRSELADMLGVERSRISHILSGSKNLQADTLADILLVLGRTPHLTLSDDFEEIRFPVDELLTRHTSSGVTQGDGPTPIILYSFVTREDYSKAQTRERSTASPRASEKRRSSAELQPTAAVGVG